jgi:SAM-dependent methyltransferase
MNSVTSPALVLNPPVATQPIRDLRTEALARLIRERVDRPVRRLLVVGCGSGKEAAVLRDVLGAKVTGIDLFEQFDAGAAAVVDLRRGDATCLEFAGASFDLVYSYHALEHIPDYSSALSEMRRVLVDGGAYCIGTPNRSRLFAYFGSPGVSLRQKLLWNGTDWKMRLRGRFRNEFGAHAGFTSAELHGELQGAFGHAEEITLDYYLRVYRNHTGLCRLLGASGLGRFLYPCVYFAGRKATNAGIAR